MGTALAVWSWTAVVHTVTTAGQATAGRRQTPRTMPALVAISHRQRVVTLR
jgi:hypothetical protein